jgi:hypothetical protein
MIVLSNGNVTPQIMVGRGTQDSPDDCIALFSLSHTQRFAFKFGHVGGDGVAGTFIVMWATDVEWTTVRFEDVTLHAAQSFADEFFIKNDLSFEDRLIALASELLGYRAIEVH